MSEAERRAAQLAPIFYEGSPDDLFEIVTLSGQGLEHRTNLP